MKPLLYTFVSEETLHSMAVTFYACVKLPIQIINEHGKTLVSEGESPHFCHLFQKHLPSYDSCEKMHISASKKAIDLGEAYIFACHADLNHIPIASARQRCGSRLPCKAAWNRPCSRCTYQDTPVSFRLWCPPA